MVVGCLEGDCHYSAGNLYARKRVNRVKEILDKVGIGGERVEMYNLSSGMGGRFAEIVQEITNKVLELGPSPIKGAAGGAARPIAEVTT
jgi:F420-non-reducing hydrogenase iron-sulfur subunit